MSATDRAYQLIRDHIAQGRFPQRARLPEDELASLTGVSRTPVREALRRLQAEGFVDFHPHRGATVAAWTREDINGMYAARARLESYAAALAAERIDAQSIDELDVLAREMRDLAVDPSHEALNEIARLNGLFHGLVRTASGSPALTQLIAGVVQLPLVHRTFHQYSHEALARSMNHHLELTAALGAHDVAWASAVMQAHVYAARHELQALERRVQESSDSDTPMPNIGPEPAEAASRD